ncbi:TPA: PRD domain-containing protein [Clostridioides difficile]|uniref:PRD domain-containing protein n=1 Tax=Clostridioides difficile TaxID=1496 RepID=UPI0004226BAF|nr:PRD domain-containing protein [Clostridioides difficile]AXU26337.1 beta-glucoside bgl operon transcription antiterminator [Clostridioides difficile]AXU30197.1 beta-glucoside bgl operon transcription antiterminator [Clostridioides difficile]AXU33985.1 beta-glucoside bgl operon transcription antiterminator [Clostridioides difficile]KJF63215.1 transcription antiterminator BglG [Clostridioides difficile]MBY1131116.1 PRD domain-containing protein [Clostridioides difficile]
MNYIIKKVLNSSVVLVHDANDNEFILLGKGIGYGKKTGEYICGSNDNQMFVPVENIKSKQFLELMDDIPVDILKLTQEIIVEAEKLLNSSFNKNLYLILADHFNFAIERMRKGIKITNRVFWEIKNYYPNEFKVGMVAIYMVEERLGIQLPEEEAANIAFHFANAMASDGNSYDTIKYAKVIGEIINIFVFSLNRTLDKKSMHYMRFITHIKFFVERFFSDSMLSSGDDLLFNQMKRSNPKEMLIALKVRDFLEKKYGKKLTNEEIAFLVIHIARVKQ